MDLSDRRPPAGAIGVVGFVLAIVVPLAGLIVSLVALRGAHRRSMRASALTVAAIPLAAVLLVVQVAGIGGAIAVRSAIAASDDGPVCASLVKFPDLFAATGPESLAGLASQEEFDAKRTAIGTWHSEVLQLAFDDPDQSPDASDPLSTGVRGLSALLDTDTGWQGKSWSSAPQQVAAIRGWRDSHCG